MLLILFGLVLCAIGVELGSLDSRKCLSECTKDQWAFGQSGYRCYTEYRKHETCSPRPQNKINGKDYYISPAYKYRMKSGGGCSAKCGYFGYSYLWCMTPDLSSWDYCATSDIVDAESWHVIKNQIQIFKDSHSTQLGFCNNYQLHNNKNGVKTNSLTDVLNLIRNNNDIVYHLSKGIDFKGPIENVDLIYIPGYGGRPETNLTLAMSAKIYPAASYNYNCDIITPSIKERSEVLNKAADDEIGYLLSNAFGATADYFNLVPQKQLTQWDATDANCGNGISVWNHIDNSLLKFLSLNDGYIEWNLVVNYGNLPTSLRPTQFLLQVLLKNHLGKPYSNPDEIFVSEDKIEIVIDNNSPGHH